VNTALQKPDPNTYWVLPGHFLAGEYPGSPVPELARARIHDFIATGVSLFIDLTEGHELAPYQQFVEEAPTPGSLPCEYRNLPIPDFSTPTPQRMREIIDTIEKALADKHTVYVHCWGGIGRTGTTVGCFLVDRGATGDEALAQVSALYSGMQKAARRPHSPETREQEEFVRDWILYRRSGAA